MFRGIIFDMDGTLLDTLDDIAFAMNAALRQLGAPEHPPVAYRLFVGQGLELLAETVLPEAMRGEETVTRCVSLMRSVYADHWADATYPYDGIPALLASLRERSIPCSVLSNKAHDFTKRIAVHFFGADAFAAVIGKGDFPMKPDPTAALHLAEAMGVAPEECLFVGDSGTDMATGINARMYPAGVLWGFREEGELVSHGAKVLVASPGEILRIVAGPSS